LDAPKKNKVGSTAIEYARSKGFTEIVDMLRKFSYTKTPRKEFQENNKENAVLEDLQWEKMEREKQEYERQMELIEKTKTRKTPKRKRK